MAARGAARQVVDPAISVADLSPAVEEANDPTPICSVKKVWYVSLRFCFCTADAFVLYSKFSMVLCFKTLDVLLCFIGFFRHSAMRRSIRACRLFRSLCDPWGW